MHSRFEVILKKKSLFTVSILLLLLLSVLSGCVQQSAPSEEFVPTRTRESTKTEATPEETEEPLTPTVAPVSTIVLTDKTLKGLSITLYHPFIDEKERVDQLVRDFNLNNVWGLHVSAKAAAGYDAIAEGLLLEDEEIVLVLAKNSDLLSVQPDVEWLELNSFANDPKWGIAGFFEHDFVFSGVLPQANQSEPLYTIPVAYNAGILFYNQQWSEELSIAEAPKNSTELLQVAKAALDANTNDNDYYNNGTGGLWLSQSPISALSWYASFGGSFENQVDGNFSPDQTAMLDSFNFLKSAYEADLTWIGVEANPYRYFSERNAILTEGSLEDIKYLSAYQEGSDLQDSWTTLPYLDQEGEGHLVLEPLSFAIKKSDSEKELGAWLFGRWLLEESQQARLAEIHGFWPSTGDPETIASDYAEQYQAWAAPLNQQAVITLVPQEPSWAQTRLVFQDAYQRVYDLAPEYFPSILEVFDQTMRINEEQRP